MNVDRSHFNTLYLLAALAMIFMTLALALQPLYLRNVLGLARDNAGSVNANIQVITEIVDLLFVGYLGYLSDQFGRVPVMVFGFIVAGWAALLLPFSAPVGLFLGLSGLTIFYLARTAMSLGTTAVWPQIATLAGDFSDQKNRPRLLAKAGFMMAFGGTLTYVVLMQIPKHAGIVPAMMLMTVIAFIGAWVGRCYLIDVAPKLKEDKLPLKTLLGLLRAEKGLRLSFLSAFSSRNDMVIIGLFLMTWSIYFADVVGMEHTRAAANAGMVIGFIGVVVLLTIPIWGEIIIRYGRVPAVVLGLLLSGIGFSAMGLIVNPLSNWVLVPAFLVGLGQAGCLLGPQTLTLDLAPAEIRGSMLGAFNTVGGIGIIFFLFTGGILFDHLGPATPFVFTGIANFLIMFYGLAILKTEPDHEARGKVPNAQ